MTLTHVANNRILFLSGNLYREDHTCQMNHPDREQNRAIIYTPGWRSPKTSRSGLHPRRPLTSATSRRNPSRPWGAPAGAWTHRHIRGQSRRRVGNPAPATVNFAPRSGRLAQRSSIPFTRQRSQDRTLYRPPPDARRHPLDRKHVVQGTSGTDSVYLGGDRVH